MPPQHIKTLILDFVFAVELNFNMWRQYIIAQRLRWMGSYQNDDADVSV